jgi:hypothetical protein
MNLKQLINQSVYGTIGYISSQNDIDLLEQYILYNLSVLNEYKQIIVVTNYKEYPNLVEKNTQLWKKYFPNCILIDLEINRGHSFGIADSENAIVDYCKENNINWLCKASNDVILEKDILDKEISEADFYYTNGIGYGGMVKYNFDFDKIINEDFFPQTNFYFIDVSKIDYLYDKNYVDETYNHIQSISNYSGRVWEYIEGWACEEFLKKCIIRNNLTKCHLIPQNVYLNLLHLVKNNYIHDCSHKNIMIEGICHFQYPNQQIIQI